MVAPSSDFNDTEADLLSRGYITKIDEEKRYGFIQSNADSFHFIFRNLSRNLKPIMHMEVEFDVEESYDNKKQRKSFSATNIRSV